MRRFKVLLILFFSFLLIGVNNSFFEVSAANPNEIIGEFGYYVLRTQNIVFFDYDEQTTDTLELQEVRFYHFNNDRNVGNGYIIKDSEEIIYMGGPSSGYSPYGLYDKD
ncbi:MAG: hypothetical protein NC182_00070 [Prevotella sp.]|nr:hypothetical protein [Staphylococcus sp.]MCM1349580.1 hypothetical protein [Prevotella sp.]